MPSLLEVRAKQLSNFYQISSALIFVPFFQTKAARAQPRKVSGSLEIYGSGVSSKGISAKFVTIDSSIGKSSLGLLGAHLLLRATHLDHNLRSFKLALEEY